MLFDKQVRKKKNTCLLISSNKKEVCRTPALFILVDFVCKVLLPKDHKRIHENSV